MFANQKLVSTAAAKEVAEAKELANAQKELGRAQAQVSAAGCLFQAVFGSISGFIPAEASQRMLVIKSRVRGVSLHLG